MKHLAFTLIFIAIRLFCIGQMQSKQATDSTSATGKPNDSTTANVKTQGEFAAYPARIFFTQDKGETGNKKLTLVNFTSDTIQLKVYINDWLRDTAGGHQYLTPGTISHSCAAWITLEKTFVELMPKEKQELQIKMEVPDSAGAVKEMKWAMLFVETKKETKLQKKGNLQLIGKTRIGIHIYETPPNLGIAEAKILNFCALPGDPKRNYRVICQNIGEKQFEAKSYLELTPLSEEGQKITIKPDYFPMFPEQVRYIDFTIPDSVPKGKYNAVAIVEPGGDAPVEAAQAIIEVK